VHPTSFLCTEDEVEAMLLSLDSSKAPDNISARMLKSTATSIAASVTTLFNMSIEIPDEWKTSSIVPIPKGKGGISPSNFRPISLFCILSKLLEKHVYNIILHELQGDQSISSDQWGFRSNRSTICSLLGVTHNWLQLLNDGKEVCMVFFDLCKVFDSVPHRPLLYKLRDSQNVLKWFFFISP
jgi:hypothetical protein